MYVYTYTCVSGTCRGQKRVVDRLEVELQRVVSHHLGAGSGTQVPCKSKCSYPPHQPTEDIVGGEVREACP